MLYKSKIKRKEVIDKFKHELAWIYLLLKVSIKRLIPYNGYVPHKIKKDINNALINKGYYTMSMKPFKAYKHLKEYLDVDYITNDDLLKKMQFLTEYIEGKFGKYKDVKISYEHHNTFDNIVINIKLIK